MTKVLAAKTDYPIYVMLANTYDERPFMLSELEVISENDPIKILNREQRREELK